MTVVDKNIALDVLAKKVIFPYCVITLILVALAVIIYRSDLPEINEAPEETDISGAILPSSKTSIFNFPHLLIGVFTLFLYVGVEVIAGNTIIGYGTYQGISLTTAKFFTSFTLMGMLAGYLMGIICIPKYFSQKMALKYSATFGIVFALLALFTHGYISVMFIALLGLANSLMYPSIWPLAIGGLGKFTKIGSSFSGDGNFGWRFVAAIIWLAGRSYKCTTGLLDGDSMLSDDRLLCNSWSSSRKKTN